MTPKIEIASDGVTIDLQGFTISGVQGSVHGISSAGVARRRLAVLDGNITGLGQAGITLSQSGFDGAQPLEHRIVHRDGSVRWVRNTPVPRLRNAYSPVRRD